MPQPEPEPEKGRRRRRSRSDCAQSLSAAASSQSNGIRLCKPTETSSLTGSSTSRTAPEGPWSLLTVALLFCWFLMTDLFVFRERVLNSTGPRMREVTISQLQPNTVYNFRVVAFNRNGAGLSSAPLKVRTGDERSFPMSYILNSFNIHFWHFACFAEAVPGKVKKLKGFALSPTSIEIRWDPPELDSSSVTHYKLFYVEAVSQDWEETSATREDETEIQVRIGMEESANNWADTASIFAGSKNVLRAAWSSQVPVLRVSNRSILRKWPRPQLPVGDCSNTFGHTVCSPIQYKG